jgi:hypothetical protein
VAALDNQPGHGHRCLAPQSARRPELASLERPRTRAGAGLSRYTRPPPPWAGSSIGTTSPAGAQSRRSSRVASRNPSTPRAPGAAYPSSNRPKREPSNEKDKELLAVLAVGRLRSRRRSGARSWSASSSPPSASWPPRSSPTSAPTAPGSGVSCNSSGSSGQKPTGAGAAATSTVDERGSSPYSQPRPRPR